MESVKIFKGYGKVNPHLEDQTPNQRRTKSKRSIIILVAVSAILLLTLIIGLMLAAFIHDSNSESSDESLVSSNSLDSIKTVCNVTRYPTSCFNSISSLNISTKPDPEIIFKLSLLVSVSELKNLSSLLSTLNDSNSQAAIKDCIDQFDDALSRLNDTFLAMDVSPGEKLLTLEKINNIQTWISAAMTDQETCMDGLEEMGSPFLDNVKPMMERSKEFLSNSLAIIAKMPILLDKFDLEMH